MVQARAVWKQTYWQSPVGQPVQLTMLARLSIGGELNPLERNATSIQEVAQSIGLCRSAPSKEPQPRLAVIHVEFRHRRFDNHRSLFHKLMGTSATFRRSGI
jgi:hypothetical protein